MVVGSADLAAVATVQQTVEVVAGKGAPRFRLLCARLGAILGDPEPADGDSVPDTPYYAAQLALIHKY